MARGDTQHNFDTREPRLGDGYASIDPITGDRDTTKTVTVKVSTYSSVTQGASVQGTKKGTIFYAGTALTVYSNDGTAVSVSMS